MKQSLNIEEFLEKSVEIPVIDVRTPAEFEHGHIPGAINIPLFDNDERAEVGTLYKQIGKETAIEKGLEFVGPKLTEYIKKAKETTQNNQILIHCWRGGMRSSSLAWLLTTAGLSAYVLNGGYKAYRQHIRKNFSKKAKLIVLSGMTGSGKTEILHELGKLGQQILDLEGIAHHKGSAFGAFGQLPQPTCEQFENDLHEAWESLDFTKPIWVEDESSAIGKVFIPEPLFIQKQEAVVIQIGLNKKHRIKRLVDEYSFFDTEDLADAIHRIKKRLGGLNAKLCLEALSRNDFETIADLTLTYYDKAYTHGLTKKNTEIIYTLELNEDNPQKSAELFIKYVEANKLQG